MAAPSPAPAGGTGEDFDSEIAAMEKELKRKRAEMEKKAAKEKKMCAAQTRTAASARPALPLVVWSLMRHGRAPL